jgi:hypothetical protein
LKLLKQGVRIVIQNLCSLNKKLDRSKDLVTVLWLLVRLLMKQAENKWEKQTDCVVMPLVD